MSEEIVPIRLPVETIGILDSLVSYRFELGQIPEPTASQYFRLLIMKDVEFAKMEISKRRGKGENNV